MSSPANPPPLDPFASLEPAPPPAEAPRVEDPPWTGGDVLRLTLVAVLAILFCSAVALALAASIHPNGRLSPDASTDPVVIVPAQAAAYALLFCFMYGLVTRRYGRRFAAAMHWNWPRHWYGFVVAGAVLSFVAQLASSLLPIPKSLPIDEFFRDAPSVWLMAFFGTLAAPLVEELFFRGFLYPVLARRMGLAPAVALTALPFALLHASQLALAWAPLLVLFVVGVLLTLTRALTRSLAASTLVHVAYNGTLFGMVWVQTDGFRHLEKIKG